MLRDAYHYVSLNLASIKMEEQDSILQESATEETSLFKSMGGRKFVIAFLAVMINFILTWFGKIEPGIYSVVMVSTVCGFIVGNVVETAVTKK